MTEVAQALQDAANKCESLEESNKAQEAELTKVRGEGGVDQVPGGSRGDQASRTDSG